MKKETVKKNIILAALQLFRERGFNNVSTRDLTNTLGLSRSHIYHYFKNWDALKLDSLGFMLDEDVAAFSVVSEQIDDSQHDAYFRALVNYLLPDGPASHWLIYLELWPLAARDQQYEQLLLSSTERWTGIVRQGLSGQAFGHLSEANKDEVARNLHALIDGYSSALILNYSADKRTHFFLEIMAAFEKLCR
ncbi:TetR/AcrR family transcriptional regulator [Pantoea dispersa]|uniref:TetR/AcrR family transcriptional regulator n=1 Tax=Pantoea dispersa TaxID=59814 RepID=UPI002DBA38C6|nr:TetR/AcrR family transcriptional regulator [Pantoea dispersa]MEB5970484.1 TetR/AcrR family transcriptional regulator [Pantoea dispersa]